MQPHYGKLNTATVSGCGSPLTGSVGAVYARIHRFSSEDWAPGRLSHFWCLIILADSSGSALA